MRKLTILFAALTLSVGLWAETQTVSYRYPVYNTDGDAKSGIKEWKDETATATVITSSTERVTWYGSWYVVKGYVTLSKGAACRGDVRLILADDAILTITTSEKYPGIQVTETNNSLTIYGQTKNNGILRVSGGEESAGIGGEENRSNAPVTINGGLITVQGRKSSGTQGMGGAGIGGGKSAAGSNIIINDGTISVTGGDDAAGIGGGTGQGGSNIIINGGKVTATGGDNAAGIGGGYYGSGSNITINGGEIEATGGTAAAGIGGGTGQGGSNIAINGGKIIAKGGFLCPGIGGGFNGLGSNITAAIQLLVKAGEDDKTPPTTIIAPMRIATTDIAADLADKRYINIEKDPLLSEKDAAIGAINAALEGIDNDNIKAIATSSYFDVKISTTTDEIELYKTRSIANINSAKAAYADGDTAGYVRGREEGKSSAFGSLGTEQNGPAVIVSDQDGKEIILYSPKKVQYIKVSDK